MDSRYYPRPLSPGGRRLVAPERSSTGTFPAAYDSHYPARSRDTFVSPRHSGERVAQPPSQYSQNTSSSSASRSSGYDSYSGRPRRSTLTDADGKRLSASATNLVPSVPLRSTRPVIHTNLDRPSSPLTRSWGEDRNTSHVTPAVTVPRREHKKTYSVDNTGHSRLIDERDVEHRRRESVERGHRSSGSHRHQKPGYHLSGPVNRPSEVTDDNYSYTDAAGMYRDTEPRWRQRRGSIDRGSRPTSMMEGLYPPETRKSKEPGPPPTMRGFDRINDKLSGGGLGRSGSLRDHNRSSSRDRSNVYYGDSEYQPHRSHTARPAVHQEREERYPYYEDRQGRSHAPRYEDPDVAARGFGIRSGSIDRYAKRGSDDSLDRDPLYPATPVIKQPDMRDYIPPPPPPREERREPDRREPDRREPDRREPDRREPDRREVDRRELDRREPDRRELDRRELDRREPDRRELDRREPERREREYAERERRDHDHRRDTDRERKETDDRGHRMSGAIPVAAAAAAAYGASEAIDRQARERRYEERSEDHRGYQKHNSTDSVEPVRERHYETEKDRREEQSKDSQQDAATLDPDEEYRRRVQQEMERNAKAAHRDRDSDSERERERERRRRDRDRSSTREAPRELPRETAHDGSREPPRETLRERNSREEAPPQPPRPTERREERQNSVFGGPVVQEPNELPDAEGEKKVKIVDPPRDSPPPPRGILKQPTQKFPEDPNPIREGVAPLKDAKKGKDIPQDARWTKIDRRLVNPEALDQAKERYEERMDCVIVLRVLTKDEIQKLADKTREIRDSREHDRERRDKNRDRDDHDRDRDRERRHRRDYDTSGDSYDEYDDDYDRDRKERDKPKAIEATPSSIGELDRRGYAPTGAYPTR